MFDDFVGFHVTQLENWADAIIEADLPTDGDIWVDIADSIGLDIDMITDSDLRLVEHMIEERAR